MAYLLGFLAADGSIIEATQILRVAVAEKDRDFLILLGQELSSTYPVRKYTSK